MFRVLASNADDRGCETRFGQPKHYTIGNDCFFAKHALLRN